MLEYKYKDNMSLVHILHLLITYQSLDFLLIEV